MNKKICLIILFLGILLLIISLTLFTKTIPEHQDKCYDKYGNEIIGQTCFVEKDWDLMPGGIILWFLSCVLIGVGVGNLLSKFMPPYMGE